MKDPITEEEHQRIRESLKRQNKAAQRCTIPKPSEKLPDPTNEALHNWR